MEVIKTYHKGLAAQLDKIEALFEAGNIKDYTIKVHALKSSSRIIGALEVADLAEALEKHSVRLRTAGICAGIVLVFFAAFRFSFTRVLMEHNYVMMAGVVIMPALVTLFLYDPIRRLFAHPWLGTLGAIAFDVYIWHDTGNVLAAILGEAFSWNAFFYSVRGMVIWIALTWLFGAFSYYCIEKPIDRRVQAWMEKQNWA